MSKSRSCIVLTAVVIIAVLCSITVEASLPPLIRFHVIANSDSPSDQALKYLVRDRVIALVEQRLAETSGLAESREILLENLAEIEATARKVLEEEGCPYNVSAFYGQYDFPTRYYGALSLPAGRYEAVRLVIGQGKGANWWCVLFPPLCFVDVNKPAGKNAAAIADSIKEGLAGKKTVKVKPAFKVVEAWQDMLEKIASK